MSHLTLQYVMVIDLCTLSFCVLIALRCASSLLHPAWMMLGCHGYVVTLRLYQVFSGQRPMAYSFVWPVQPEEIMRAALASDAALLAMAAAWVIVRFRGRRRAAIPKNPEILLSPSRVRIMAALSILCFVAAVAIVGPRGMVEGQDPNTISGIFGAAGGWAPWGACLLIFMDGFSLSLSGLAVACLVISMMLSKFRGVVIIPLIFLLFTWLARRKSKRLPVALIPAVGMLWLIWLPMKPIVYSLQAGRSLGDSLTYGIDVAFGDFGKENGSGIDFQFLDMVGSTMTLVDIHGARFWGGTVEPLLVGFVPRAFWPEKPKLNEYQKALDIPSRNMAQLNMTAGLLGEAYANFGYVGIVAVPFLISLAFSSAYSRLSSTNLLTPGALLYLIFLSTYMQLYRDGLISGIWFPFVHCAPMGWTALWHWIWPVKKARRRIPIPSTPNLFPGPGQLQWAAREWPFA